MSIILVVFGTRPEYIKVNSIIKNFTNIKTCFTGQHCDLLNSIDVDYKLSIDDNISENRLNNIYCNIMKYSHIFENVDYVLVQGDTSSATAMALSAFHHGKKVIHLEAGLRSGNNNDPYPEEMNRQIISRIACIHLCPTESNKQNLLKENVSGSIYVVGNTGLDNIDRSDMSYCNYENKILVTLHRRDNIDIMDQWFIELEKVAEKYQDHEFMLPIHPNPDVRKHKYLLNKVKVVDPMSHDDLINYMKKCKFIITDSGGLQEEGSYLNKKIIVCRKTTERPEILGIFSELCNPNELLTKVDNLMNNYIIEHECPYGDGNSWSIIYDYINKERYWNNFYNNNKLINEQSSFANFVLEYLKDYPEHKRLIDLGCGNGRDLIFFSNNNYNVTGIDIAPDICNNLRYKNLNIICDSFVDYKYKNYSIYYSRFTLHAINFINVKKFIKNLSIQMNEDSLLFIETRSIIGTEYDNLNYYEYNFNSGIGDFHNRTLFNKKYLISLFNEYNIFVEYENEQNGLSIYNNEDPYLIRLVLRKINVKKNLQNILKYSLKKQYLMKQIIDKYLKLLDDNNIKYCIFFGNLIGLLRHNNLFIPWDDDIDIIINKDNIYKVKELIESNFTFQKIIISDTTLIVCINDYIWIDFWYDISNIELCKGYTLDLNEIQIINSYKCPINYKDIFEKFYKQSVLDIMNTCVIYNHSYNNRWDNNHFVKVIININDCNKILKEINNDNNNIFINNNDLFLNFYDKNGYIYIVNTTDFNNYEDIVNILLKLIKIQKYSKIIINSDDYFEVLNKNLITTNFNDLNININDQIILNDKCIEITSNDINEKFINSLLKFNNKLEISNIKLEETIRFFYLQYNIYLFGLSFLLLLMNYSNIKILQFMLINKKINDIDLSQYKILNHTYNWIQFEYNTFIIEIFEYTEINNKLIVNEKIYKDTIYYDNLRKLIKPIYINNNLIESYIYTNINTINKNMNINENDYFLCK